MKRRWVLIAVVTFEIVVLVILGVVIFQAF